MHLFSTVTLGNKEIPSFLLLGIFIVITVIVLTFLVMGSQAFDAYLKANRCCHLGCRKIANSKLRVDAMEWNICSKHNPIRDLTDHEIRAIRSKTG